MTNLGMVILICTILMGCLGFLFLLSMFENIKVENENENNKKILIKENEELKEEISELHSKISELYQEDRHRRNLELFKRKNPNFEGYLMIGFSQKEFHCESDEKYIIDSFKAYVLKEDLISKMPKQSKVKGSLKASLF